MLQFIVLVSILITGIFLIAQSRKKEPKKILNVYSQPGKWYFLKYVTFLLLLNLRRLISKLIKRDKGVVELEKLQPLSHHELAFDAVFFQAVTQNGIYFCCGTERRQEGKISGLVYIVVPEYGVLESEKLPNTTLNADPVSLLTQEYYAAEGITITPVTPMKKWKVCFKGKMRQQSNPDNFVSVELEAEWKSNYPWFIFEVDMPSKVIARAIARETWSKSYFKMLEEAHQTHYEQMGYLSGNLKINENNIPLVEVDAFRDHSFGFKRDWSLMHRYIYHMFYLENQVKISFGVVSQPCTSSYLEMGHVTYPDGKMNCIECSDLLLYQHGENGVLPKDLCFTFSAGGVTYEVKVIYEYEAMHYKGKNDEARMCERFLRCEVNGIHGRGISEWHYNEKHLK